MPQKLYQDTDRLTSLPQQPTSIVSAHDIEWLYEVSEEHCRLILRVLTLLTPTHSSASSDKLRRRGLTCHMLNLSSRNLARDDSELIQSQIITGRRGDT